MYQSMTNYEQSNDFYRRQTCFTSNNPEVPSLNSPLNHQFHDPQYRFNQPQMLTFYPNLNRNPNMFSHMPGLSANRHFDEYPSGNSPYRLINMREGFRSSKLPPRPKNIVKITNPETGDNIFNELEKERKLNIPTESKNEDNTKSESVDSPQSSPTTLSSTNLITQQPSIQNLTSEESQSPKAFHVPPGSCESNSLMTNSSASSRPPSVNLASTSQEMPAQNHSYFVPPAMNGHKGRQYFGRGGPIMDVSYNERPGFHDQSKSMYCNQLPMMIPTYGCRPPYIPSHVQQMSGPRYGGYYNLPHNFYDQTNYYYEGEAVHQYFPHNNAHGYQMHSRFPGLSHQNVPISQSGSGSNSSEELNSECDIQFVSARLLDKSIRGRGNKYLRRESKEDVAGKSEEDVPNDSNNSFDIQDSFGRPTPMEDSGKDSKLEDQQSTAPVKEITLDPNAKSFVYVGTLVESGKQVMETSGDKLDGIGGETFAISGNLINAGLEMKRFSSKGSNMDHMDGDTLGRMKKNSMSMDTEDNKSSSSLSKMFRSGSEGGNLEKNPVVMPNGMPVSSERRNTDTNIGKSGRIQYSRDFLLNLQFEPDSLKAPKGLAIFPEIILNGKVPDVHHRRQFIGGEHHHNIPPFMHPTNQGGFSHAPSMSLPSVMHPNMVVPSRYPYHHPVMLMPPSSNQQLPHHHPQPAPTMGRQVRGKSFVQQQCPQQPSRKIIQVCLGKNVQLHQSENAWKPMTLLAGRKEDEVEGDEVEIMDLYRKVRSILNKLTPQKFDTLIQQVHDLSIDTEEKLKGCIKLIFEKAIGEPSFSLAYAQMAKSLNNLKVHVDERPGETVTFRKLLLNQCQKEFEKDKLEELDLEKMSKQIEQATSDRERQQLLEIRKEAEKVAKRRSLGNIRFIGELFKLKMLTDHIMFDCINRLMRYSSDEDNVECLCRLLVTIGKDLDSASPTSKQKLNLSFQELKHLSMKPQLSSRIRFMVQDVMELRENDWIPRREDTKPKLIEQIHKEAELERLGSSQQHKTHHQSSSSSSSVPHDLQRSASLASSSLDHHRGSFDKSSLVQQNHHHHQGRGSIDRNLRQQADRFGSLERVKMSDSFSGGGGNGSSKLNVYATLGHNRRYPARPLTGGGNSMSSSDLGRTLDSLRGDTSAIQLAPSLYKQVQHKPWQEGSSGGGVRQISDVGPLPPTALRSRGSASDIYGRSFARSPIRIAPRSRVFDPKTLERDKHAAIAAAKSISSSTSADSFINPPTRVTRDPQLHFDKPPHFSARAVTLSPRELANQKKELEKKCQSLLDEYLTTDDLQEACLTFREFHSSMKGCTTQMLALTNHLVNSSLEKSDKDRHKIGVLLSHLVLKNLISVDTYLDSISSILKDAHDTAIDIPKVWDYLAELVSRAILGKVFSFRNLTMLCVAIGNQEKQAEFVGHVIKTTTSGFVTELNAAVQPNFIADLILFLGNIGSNGKGDNRTLNEDQLRTHSTELKKCLVSTDLEWQVLMFIKNEIMGGSDAGRAPSLLSSMMSALQRCEILSSGTIARWNGSSNGCK